MTRAVRIDRALRYRWLGVLLGLAAMSWLWGVPLFGAIAAVSGPGLVIFRLMRGDGDRLAITARSGTP